MRKIISGEGRQTITGRDRHNIISDTMPAWEGILSRAKVEALVSYIRLLAQ